MFKAYWSVSPEFKAQYEKKKNPKMIVAMETWIFVFCFFKEKVFTSAVSEELNWPSGEKKTIILLCDCLPAETEKSGEQKQIQ